MRTIHRAFVVLLVLVLLVGAVFATGAFPAAAGGGGDLKPIFAKALDDHGCDSSEWHFVITQIDNVKDCAPSHIYVTWADGGTEAVPLWKTSGKVAHYVTTSHLDSSVVAASTYIYQDWAGQFNLSHGPCLPPPPPPPPPPPGPERVVVPALCQGCWEGDEGGQGARAKTFVREAGTDDGWTQVVWPWGEYLYFVLDQQWGYPAIQAQLYMMPGQVWELKYEVELGYKQQGPCWQGEVWDEKPLEERGPCDHTDSFIAITTVWPGKEYKYPIDIQAVNTCDSSWVDPCTK